MEDRIKREKCILTPEELDSLFQILKEKLGSEDYLVGECGEIAFKKYFRNIIWHLRNLESKEQLYDAVKKFINEIDLVTYKLLQDALHFEINQAIYMVSIKDTFDQKKSETTEKEARTLSD